MTNQQSQTVSVIKTSTNLVVKTVLVGPQRAILVSLSLPTRLRCHVANAGSNGNGGSNTVSVIDTSTNRVVKTVTACASGFGNWGVAITPNGSEAYVSNPFSNALIVIKTATNTVVKTVPSNGPLGLAIT